MKINVHLEDVILPVECGEGRQKLKWLATVSCIRYGLLQSEFRRLSFFPAAGCQGAAVARRPTCTGLAPSLGSLRSRTLTPAAPC
jgi:hypothetical protein